MASHLFAIKPFNNIGVFIKTYWKPYRTIFKGKYQNPNVIQENAFEIIVSDVSDIIIRERYLYARANALNQRNQQVVGPLNGGQLLFEAMVTRFIDPYVRYWAAIS